MSLRLGIDTGGTYTDAVLVDDDDKIVAAAKNLTTHYELAIGIRTVLTRMEPYFLTNVSLVSLSTTLTTNSVVEGRGAPVCGLFPGYEESQLRQAGLYDILDSAAIVTLAGGHDALGSELVALDEESARQIIMAHSEGVSAFAISAMFAIRNPAHELRLREMVEQISGKPVTCGHELSANLGAPRRAQTVVLNARMVPYIRQLIQSVQNIMDHFGIEAPLMIVQGDGSLVGCDTALKHPVTTVLSGPAASVVGACSLSGVQNALVVDMGGTTTDIAIVTDGQPELSSEGAMVGEWKPMVEAVKVYSIGLGGDSELRFCGDLQVGPRRVVPLSLLTYDYPDLISTLKQQLESAPNPRNNRFVLPLDGNEDVLRQLSDEERQAWEQVSTAPQDFNELFYKDRYSARVLAQMERKGLVIYSGFTPTDAAHVLNLSDHWNQEGARLAALLWARQMRYLYGFGSWPQGDAISPSRQIFDRVIQLISQKLIEAGLQQTNFTDSSTVPEIARCMANLILKTDRKSGHNPLIETKFVAGYPIVAVGAPASTYYPEVVRRLNIGLYLPDYAEVANAVGSVMGRIVQRAHVTITQPSFGQFCLFSRCTPEKFDNLNDVKARAEELVIKQSEQLAIEAGAEKIKTEVCYTENHVKHDIDGDLFFEARVTATSIGKPNYSILSMSTAS